MLSINDTLIEELMSEYNDYNYVKHVLQSEFSIGYNFVLLMYKRKAKRTEENYINRLWDMFLIQVENGYQESFDTYCELHKNKTLENNMSNEEKNKKEAEILSKFGNLKNNKFKVRRY